MKPRLNPKPKLHIRLIRTNPPRRYCTKQQPVRLSIPYWAYCDSIAQYVAAFNLRNFLKP